MKEITVETSSLEKTRTLDLIKLRILALGLIIIIISFLIFQFFFRLRYPPELNLPPDLQPSWTADTDLIRTMAFIGDVGLLISWIFLFIGLILAVYGIINRMLERKLRESEFDLTIVEQMVELLKTERNFVLLVGTTILFALLWIFNLLTFPASGPLYFMREWFLKFYFPDVPIENLPALSTYGTFAVIQDTAILALYFYIIYIKLRPGKQLGEDFANFALDKTLFLVVLLATSLYHAIGHMPFELYGRGQWGTGYSTLESWIAFDKIGHMFTSMAITMLLVALLTNQFAKYGAESRATRIFGLVVAIAFMISIGLAWEIYEWITNWLLALGHFEDEILDAPKDLLWDAIGAVIGALLAFYDMNREQTHSFGLE